MTLPQPLPGLADIIPYKGGESVLPGHAAPVKLSSNENALGASPAAKAAYLGATHKLEIYPDGAQKALKTAIARHFGLEPTRIQCGAGSDELFQLLGRGFLFPGDEVIHTAHGFLAYGLVARQCLATAIVTPEPNLKVDIDALLGAVTARTKIVFLANPNNPTGAYIPRAEIERLHRGLPSHVLLVIDGAYAEYVDAPDFDDSLGLAWRSDNVVVTRTFSKIHGLAALRLGWAYCPAPVAAILDRVRAPFNVSGPALAAGIAALEDRAHAKASADFVRDERARLSQTLRAAGICVHDGVCNFVLARFASPAAAQAADQRLRAGGLIVRSVASYNLPDCLRITIGPSEANRRVGEILSKADADLQAMTA